VKAPAPVAGPSAVGGDEETAKIEAMFKAQNDYWSETKETMSQCVFSSRSLLFFLLITVAVSS